MTVLAADLIAEAEAATTLAEVDAIEAQAEGRVTVLDACAAARDRINAAAAAPATPTQQDYYGHTTVPDFVWIGCPNCYAPKDWMRPVLSLTVWQSDTMRRLNYVCEVCHNDIFPMAWGLWMEDAHPWDEGGFVPASTEVKRWGV